MERRGVSLGALGAIVLGEPLAIASITASELLVGVHRSTNEWHRSRRRDFVEHLVSQVPVLSFDLESARTHAQLAAELAAVGQPIGSNNLLIAATAIARGYSALTHNLRHFERVPGLIVQVPGW
ncbi:MAG: PIN domain-containing protein [Chloroflexi bacterium]|nr:PIN domain-containing protein [Chloroflexota bacterium]